MAIHGPYGPNDVFATPEEAVKCDGATVTEIPRSAFEQNLGDDEARALVREAARIAPTVLSEERPSGSE